jgi:hypothetical protein
MIRHRCPDCHHMMESSDHLMGMEVHCHVCREPMIVPQVSSSESGSFVLAKARASKPETAATSALPETAELIQERWQGFQVFWKQQPALLRWTFLGLLTLAVLATVGTLAWWLWWAP